MAALLHGEEDIGTLEVAVPHIQAMHVLDRCQQLVHEVADMAGGELASQFMQISYATVLHHKVYINPGPDELAIHEPHLACGSVEREGTFLSSTYASLESAIG